MSASMSQDFEAIVTRAFEDAPSMQEFAGYERQAAAIAFAAGAAMFAETILPVLQDCPRCTRELQAIAEKDPS